MSNTERSRDSLKALFEDGDKPTGSDFNDLITTMATLDDTRYLVSIFPIERNLFIYFEL